MVLEDRSETEQESSLLLSVSVVQGSLRVARPRSWSKGEYGTEQGGWSVHGSRGYFTAACNKDQVMRGPWPAEGLHTVPVVARPSDGPVLLCQAGIRTSWRQHERQAS